MKAYLEAYYPDLLTATGKAATLSGNENNLTTDEATALSGNEDETSEAVTIAGNIWVSLYTILFVRLRSIYIQNFD